jgi:hypothetical protein
MSLELGRGDNVNGDVPNTRTPQRHPISSLPFDHRLRLDKSLCIGLARRTRTMAPLLEIKNLTCRRDEGSGSSIFHVSHPLPLTFLSLVLFWSDILLQSIMLRLVLDLPGH